MARAFGDGIGYRNGYGSGFEIGCWQGLQRRAYFNGKVWSNPADPL